MIHEVKKKIQKLFTWYKCTKFNAGLSEDENGNLINRAIFFLTNMENFFLFNESISVVFVRFPNLKVFTFY